MKLIRNIDVFLERQLSDMYFIGKLAEKKDLTGTLLHDSVRFQDEYKEHIQFQIKCLSEIPGELSDLFSYNNRVFTGSTRSNANTRLLSSSLDRHILPDDKKDAVKEYLKTKLILFKMTPLNQGTYLYIDMVEMIDVDSFESEYILVPQPELKNNETRTDFEYKISKKLLPFNLPCYPNLLKVPEYIYCEKRLYCNLSLKNTQNNFTYIQEFEEEVEYLEEEDSQFMSNYLFRYRNLYIVSMRYAFELRDVKKKSVHAMLEHQELKEENNNSFSNEDDTNTIVDINNAITSENEAERVFLERLKENVRARGLIYTDEDLINFHTCVKTNLLTIIGGMSGIGKSQLAILYAETLGLNFGKELVVLPISPAYTEPNDILGYLNPNTGIYNESEMGLVKLLMEAEADSNRTADGKLYMVVFDEMNLAQVEHWFSPFISLLELDKEKRMLTLFNENSHCVNNYRAKIKIADNVLFIGTVNFDETTKLFSDRLLDRANIFIPQKSTLSSLYQMLNDNNKNGDVEPIHCTRKMYRKWTLSEKQSLESLNLENEEIAILDKLHSLINAQDRQKGVSFRTAKSIAMYLNNIPLTENGLPSIDRKRAFDLQINQRIITKIRGIESFVRPLVGSYTNEDDYQKGRISEYLTSDETATLFEFTETLLALKQKAKELMYYGFAY